MNDILLDSVFPYITMGAIVIVILFFSFYLYYVEEPIFRKYRNYLGFCFLYLVMKEMVLVPKYTQNPLSLYLLSECFIWGSFVYYVRFIYSTVDFKDKKPFFEHIVKISQIILILGFILYVITQVFFKEYKDLFSFIYIFISLYMLLVAVIFIVFLYKSRTFLYYKYLYLGSVFLLIFNIIASFFDDPSKNFFGFTNLSIICIGWFLELIMFLIALGIKVKNEWEEKHRIMRENLEHEKKILLQEIDSQKLAYQSRQSERLRISIDIHDGISNAITGLKFYISDKRLQTKENSEKILLQDIEQELNSIYIQVRDYIQKLYGGQDEEKYDILLFLSSLQKQYNNSNLNFITDIEEVEINRNLNIYQQNELYFILNECIGNSIKHARCNTIKVSIYFENHICYFKIKDNGKGFDFAEKLNSDSGLGLSNILQRIKKLEGNITFENSGGTLISGNFPYPEF
ncbi:sensor histidine kinase [Chryseobacterium limigenitum]|uniref:histidine kinase n=1 Tax=Chryseobacterium limigenitum TaxID=1612149 RepID=A0A1K2IX08_9FLAO|nr:ATP-binding protein [Chryseobacterium limigenitum]SFZ96957.1 Signal transduction histidine kinase [Chryseobacterium limigenitum]